ncbi:MAG TPA: response regulator [Myxococcaceae bacterium]|nr:response regulator [Myxococcaceae bacterium]
MLESKRILVTDGHSSQHHLVTRSLERAGYRVLVAHSVHEAWECLGRAPADLWVLDPDLTEADATDLIRQARALQPGLPVLVVSEHTFICGAEVGGGINVLVTKPIRNWGALVEAVSDTIRLAEEAWFTDAGAPEGDAATRTTFPEDPAAV